MHAVAGFAYGAVGADIHVFGDGTPVYLLYARNERGPARPDSAWLRAQPSRMLDARRAVVEFTGREAEIADLLAWRDGPAGLSVHWLHGPGGSGKSRLAARLATACADEGWLVVDAVHGTDAYPLAHGGQDLSTDGRRGVLLLVDYADRWPDGHLSWLFQNSLIRRTTPTRVLLIGRSVHAWPALRAQLSRLRTMLDTSDQLLSPLPPRHDGERARMFAAAHRGFAAHYPAAEDVPVPAQLGRSDFGLTLAVHMAALVAVDASATGREAPTDLTGMTAYLLDREQDNWRQVRADRSGRAVPTTIDAGPGRAAFTAVLTGSMRREQAETLLHRLMPGSDATQVLADHSACYPPPGPGATQVLEPLQPDRLAEDFLALTLPGSPVTGYPTDLWTVTAATRILQRDLGTPPPYTPRALLYLTSAAARWPHVGHRLLYPLLRRDPELAVRAGSPVLSSLAAFATVDVDVLARIEALLPHGDIRVETGAADLTTRLATERLKTTGPGPERARLHSDLSRAAITAGRVGAALDHAEEAVRLFREEADRSPEYRFPLAEALTRLGGLLTAEARRDHGIAQLQEAAGLLRAIDAGDVATARLHLFLAVALWEADRRDEALDLVRETEHLYQRLSDDDLTTYLTEMSSSADLHRVKRMMLAASGQVEDAVEQAEWDLEYWRQRARRNPATHGSGLAKELRTHSRNLWHVGRHADAVDASREAVHLYRQLAEVRPDDWRPLAEALTNESAMLAELDRHDEATRVADEALTLYRGSPHGDEDLPAIARLLRYGRERRAARRVAWCTSEEIDRTAARLARSGRRTELWALIRAVPVADAIRVARRHRRDTWLPPEGDPNRQVALRLATRDPRSAARDVAAAARASAWRAPYVIVRARQLSFAPGQPVMAVEELDARSLTVRVEVVDLESRSALWTAYDGPVEHEAISCHSRDSVLAVRTPGADHQLVRYRRDGEAEEVLASGVALTGARIAATADGYVVALPIAPVVLLVRPDGSVGQVDLGGLGLGCCTRLAVDPTGTRLALTDGTRLVVTDAGLARTIARTTLADQQGPVVDLVFASPDEIVTTAAAGSATLYQVESGQVFTAEETGPGPRMGDLFTVPAWGTVGGWLPGSGKACFLDAVTLRPVTVPASLIGGGHGMQTITASPDGHFVAYGGWLDRRSADWSTVVHDLRSPPSWLPHPVAALSPADLTDLRAFLDTGEPVPPPTRELLALLRDLA